MPYYYLPTEPSWHSLINGVFLSVYLPLEMACNTPCVQYYCHLFLRKIPCLFFQPPDHLLLLARSGLLHGKSHKRLLTHLRILPDILPDFTLWAQWFNPVLATVVPLKCYNSIEGIPSHTHGIFFLFVLLVLIRYVLSIIRRWGAPPRYWRFPFSSP